MAFYVVRLTMKKRGGRARCFKICLEKELGVAPVRSTPIGRTSRGKLSPTHEYALFYGGESAVPGPLIKTEKEKRRYPLLR